MQARPIAPSPHSITAIAVSWAFIQGAKLPAFAGNVPADAVMLTKHFYKYAVGQLPGGIGKTTFKALGLFSHSIQTSLFNLYERLFAGGPGYWQHIVMRKRLIEQQTRKMIEAGISQVIVLGAGYDNLMLRIHREYPNVQFFEIDYGTTAENKQAALQLLRTSSKAELRKYAEVSPNLQFINCDLATNDVHAVLMQQRGFDTTKPCFVILEGFTPYVSLNAMRTLLKSLHELESNSQIILSFVNNSTTNLYSRKMLEETNEEYKCELSLNEALGFVQMCQYTMLGKVISIDFQRESKHINAIEKYSQDPECCFCEHYYLLRQARPTDELKNDINKIPNLLANSPQASTPRPN